MKHVTAYILTLLLLSCNNNSKQDSRPVDNSSYMAVDEIETIDTVAHEVPEKESATNSKSNASGTSSQSISKPSGYKTDNMRGFDPASEDDMEDNGMSRYMENNDEEGWD